MNKVIYTYITTNSINGKQYIGSHATEDVDDGYLGSGRLIIRAIKKHGKDNFKREIIEFHEERDAAFKQEGELIYLYNTVHPNGYNLSPTGGAHANGLAHPETKKRQSESLKRSYKSGRKKSWNKGKTKADHPVLERWSKERVGNTLSSSSRKKVGEASKGNQYSRGVIWTNEQRAKKWRPVSQFDLNGDFIKEWPSATIAAEKLGLNKYAISQCSCGRLKTSGGFKWAHKKANRLYEIEQRTLDGKLLSVWTDVVSAASSVGRSPSGIWAAIRGQQCSSAGYKWIKVEKDA